MAELEVTVVSGSGAGHASRGSTVVVGRNPDNDVVVSDDQVSRRHAQLRATTSGVEVSDLGSKNGTSIVSGGGRRTLRPGTSTTVAANGFELRLGATTLRIRVVDERIPAAPMERLQPQRASEPAATVSCPFCLSSIPASASKCQQCGEWLDGRREQERQRRPVAPPRAAPQAPVIVNIPKQESNTFAIVTLILSLFLYPIGALLTLVGLITGPKRGCFVGLFVFNFGWLIVLMAIAPLILAELEY